MSFLAAVQQVLGAVQAAYVGRPDEPKTVTVYAGPPEALPADSCKGGALFIAVSQIAPEPGTVQSGAPQIAAGMQLVVGVLRCAPSMDKQGRPPEPDQHLAAADQVLSDAEVMLEAIITLASGPEFSAGDLTDVAWAPIIPDGGVGGGAVSMLLGVTVTCS